MPPFAPQNEELQWGFRPEPPRELLERAAEIAAWIITNSDYERLERMPSFVILPRATINYIIFNQIDDGYTGQDCIRALYLPHVVLLADDFDLSTCSDTLVHELVHHFQFEGGRQFRCDAEAELEAYEMQMLWVRQTGDGDMPSPLFLRRLTCENPHDHGD